MRHSPLDAVHRSLQAKMVPFGGWDMPVSYPSGTLEEHRACRQDAAVFDVSHLGTVRVRGANALDALQRAFTNDLRRIAPGKAQYTHLVDPADASVVDDIIVWWRADGLFDVMPNASNTDRVVDALLGEGPSLCAAEDVTAERAVLAVQGPNARRRLAAISAEAAELRRFHVADISILGAPCVVAGTGYTGEDGVEVAVPREHASRLWEALVAEGVQPAGLGARDTLRLEAGLPLHGHELGAGITPWDAGLGWVVRLGKGPFRGSEALARAEQDSSRKVLVGLRFEGRQPAREGAVLHDGERQVGIVTSGNFSPTLGYAIALAFVERSHAAPGTSIEANARGRVLPATVVTLPFYRSG